MTALLKVSEHYRPAPRDRFESVRAAKTAQLYRGVDKTEAVLRRMERELSRLVAFNCRKEIL
jgi:hypothetical protein